MDQKVNIGQRSTTSVEFLKSSIFIPLTLNLKRICISAHWIQPPIVFEVNIGQRSTTLVNFLKSTIFIPLTWYLNRICTSDHWIKPPLIFLVKFVLWILQVSCYARHLSCLFVRTERVYGFSLQSLVGLTQNFHHWSNNSCRMF